MSKSDELGPEISRRALLQAATVLAVAPVAINKALADDPPADAPRWRRISDMADAKFGAVHGIDVSASFNNARDTMLSTSAAAGKLIGAKFSAAWAAFAKTGDPNNSEIPAWAPFDAAKRTTMVFDPEIRAVDDYRGDLIRMLATTT